VSRRAALVLAFSGAISCAYYNAMWSAERFAKEARRAEAKGNGLEARSWWARAAVKAESVVARHPKSRWAEPALVLQGEGWARSGACDRAAAPLALALRDARDPARRERAALAAAECALDARDARAARHALAEVTGSGDGRRRSRAALLAGRVAELEREYASAAEWYGRSAEPGAGLARGRMLLAAGAVAAAVALVDTLVHDRVLEADWAALLEEMGRGAGPDTARRALDRLLATRRVPTGARGRLLLADGDRLLAAGRGDAAGARYADLVDQMPDSIEGQRARVRGLRVRAAQADSLGDLAALRAELTRLVRGGTLGAAAGEARSLEGLLRRALDPADVPDGGGTEFRTAELVRDSIGAPRLAGHRFLRFAGAQPASIFAAKALVAAAALLPEMRDSLIGVLEARYPASPYTLALRGDPSPAFAAAEDSLARALGIEVAAPAEVLGWMRVAAPVPGWRGPELDPPPTTLAGPRPAGLARPRADERRPVPDEDDRPVRRPRPAARRDSL
jgi:hypothetical protein